MLKHQPMTAKLSAKTLLVQMPLALVTQAPGFPMFHQIEIHHWVIYALKCICLYLISAFICLKKLLLIPLQLNKKMIKHT